MDIRLTGSSPRPFLVSPPAGDLSQNAKPGWKSEITAKVRAHRVRGSRVSANQPVLPGMEDALSPQSIAARVAERYALLPSYREVMAARAGAKLSTEMPDATNATSQEPAVIPVQATLGMVEAAEEPAPYQAELLRYSVSSDSLPAPRATPPEACADFPSMEREDPEEDGGDPAVDPLEAALVEPTIPLPASFVMQPRELIAASKARPRLAEGPLREEAETAAWKAKTPDRAIAEAAEDVANSPAGGAEFLTPETRAPEAAPEADPAMPRHSPPVSARWLSIDLDSDAPVRDARTDTRGQTPPVLHVANFEDRFFAGLIDFALTLVAFLMFFLVFVISSTSLPQGRVALISAGVTLFAMWLIYQLLFFGFTDATPGMRYVKIALCTFDDENPSRGALRGRIAALLLSALPLGLGFLWAVFDEDSLGWHDRITQTYQRSYR